MKTFTQMAADSAQHLQEFYETPADLFIEVGEITAYLNTVDAQLKDQGVHLENLKDLVKHMALITCDSLGFE